MANVAPLMSNYPGGFAQGVSIRGVPLLSAYPGKVFWVDSVNGSNGNDGTFANPWSTVNYAFTQCTAARGDVIMCKAGHVETVISATACLMNISSVAVVGLGIGSLRPKFLFTTIASASVVVSAANVSITNCQFVASILSCASAITLTTAKFFTLQNCVFTDLAAATDFLACVVSTGAANTADGLTVQDTQWYGTGVTSVASFCTIAAANDSVVFVRNRFITERTATAPIALAVTTGASTNIELGDNVCISKQGTTTNGGSFNVSALSTGVVYRNYQGTLQTGSDELFLTTVGLFPYENRVSGVVGKAGFLIPATDS